MSSKTRDPLEHLIVSLEDPEFQEALYKLVTIVKNLEKSGILDLLETITDPIVIERITQLLVTTGLMKLGDKIDSILDTIGEVSEILEKPVEPVTITGLLSSLKDPEVARGLARALEILRVLGRLQG